MTILIDQDQINVGRRDFGLIASNNPDDPDAGPVEKAVLAITVKCPPCEPPTPVPPTPGPTPTSVLEGYRDAWSTYTDEQYGFQFDYPTYYDVIGCGVRAAPPELLEVGSWNWLTVLPSGGLTLDEYVDQEIQELDQLDGPYHPAKDEARLNREPRGILVEVLIAHHGNTFAYFERDGLIYAFHARHNAGCMAPEIGIVNPAVFYQIVESFRFAK